MTTKTKAKSKSKTKSKSKGKSKGRSSQKKVRKSTISTNKIIKQGWFLFVNGLFFFMIYYLSNNILVYTSIKSKEECDNTGPKITQRRAIKHGAACGAWGKGLWDDQCLVGSVRIKNNEVQCTGEYPFILVIVYWLSIVFMGMGALSLIFGYILKLMNYN